MVEKVFARDYVASFSSIQSSQCSKLTDTSVLSDVWQMAGRILRREVQVGLPCRKTHLERSHVDVQGVGLLASSGKSYCRAFRN